MPPTSARALSNEDSSESPSSSMISWAPAGSASLMSDVSATPASAAHARSAPSSASVAANAAARACAAETVPSGATHVHAPEAASRRASIPTARRTVCAASMLREYAASPRSARRDSVALRSPAICAAIAAAEKLGVPWPSVRGEGFGASAPTASASRMGDAGSFSSCKPSFAAAIFASMARTVSDGREPQPANMSSALGALDASRPDMSSCSSEEHP